MIYPEVTAIIQEYRYSGILRPCEKRYQMIKQNIEDLKPTLKKTDFPTVVVIESTAYCNLDCIMCPQAKMKRPRGNMEMGVYKKIIDEIAAEGPETQVWFAIMGEPLLNSKVFIEMLKYAQKKNIKNLNLNTNGCLITKEIAEELLGCGLYRIIIGVDAASKKSYELIRRHGNYEDAIARINLLIDRKKELGLKFPELIMQFIAMEENEDEIEAFKEYWLTRGATVKIRPRLGWGKGVTADNLIIPESERTFPCPWLVRTMSIHWNGTVAQCDGDWSGEYSVGNVKEHYIKEIWNGPLEQRRDRHWKLDFDFKPCSECKDWSAGLSYFYRPEDE
jgi:radical SAM protein with 4Fe4S-binding SPASM domain